MFSGLMLDTWLTRPLLVPALVSLFGGGAPNRVETRSAHEEPSPAS